MRVQGQADDSLPASIELLGVHDHACLIHTANDDSTATVARYLAKGLERGEYCVYLSGTEPAATVTALKSHGVDVESAIDEGMLVLGHAWSNPDPAAVRAFLDECLLKASANTPRVLRVAIEAAPPPDDGAANDSLLLCERTSETFFATTRSVGLCIYNRDTLPPRLLCDVIRCHPVLIIGETIVRNFYYVPLDELLSPQHHEREVERLLTHLHERQSLENCLRDQIRETQLILQTSLEGFYRMALDGTILEANDAFAAMVGYPRRALQGLKVQALQPGLSPEEAQRQLEELLRAGSGRFESQYRRRDGLLRDVAVSVNLVNTAGGVFFVCFCRDITEHKAVTTELCESERRYRQMLENTRLLAVMVNAEGCVTFCNGYFERLTGWNAAECVGRNWFETFVPEADRALLYSKFTRTIAAHCDLPHHAESEIITRNGDVRTVVWSTCTLHGPHGQVAGAASVGVDITERKRAEEALNDSRERFRELAELLPEIVYEMDATGRITFANHRSLEITGYTREELESGVSALDLVVEEQRDTARQYIRDGMLGIHHPNHEYTLFTKDGRRMLVMSRTSIIYKDGAPVGLRGILFDITERKKAEEALRRNEERTRAILQAIPDLIFLNDKDGVFLEFHSGETRPILPPKEFLGHKMRDVLPPQLEPLCKAFDRTVKTGKPQKVEYPLTFGKHVRYFEARIVPCHDDTILSVIREITDRRLAEEALVLARDFHLTLLEEFPSLVWRADDKGVCDYFNRTWLDFTGRSLDEERHGGWLASVHPEDSERCRRIRTAAFEARAPFELEFRLRRKDGEYRWVTDIGRPFNDLQGQFAGFVGSCYDISDRKNAETERRNLESKIKQTQKLESLGVLAGGIAHDFNNLLTGILGHADLAMLEIAPDSPAYDSLRHVETAARRAAELTKQLLAYSGKGRFVVTSVNLSRLIEEMVHLIDVSVSKKSIIRYECAAELPGVEADASQLRQVVMNLIINASEAIGDQSGIIGVRTDVIHCSREYLSQAYLDENLPEGSYVCLEVSDTGCGMSDATRARIFDPFFTTKFTGRGLGLAAVLGIVRGHRGAIQVTSKLGEGTKFRVLFPASVREAIENDVVRRPAPSWRGRGTILVVDDEETVRRIARKMLERVGLTVLTAEDGQDGVEVFEAHADEIRAVLLDVTMPRMDGREAFHRFQQIRPGVPVILSSGFNEQDVTDEIHGSGLVGFVQKPYVIEELLSVLRQALDPH